MRKLKNSEDDKHFRDEIIKNDNTAVEEFLYEFSPPFLDSIALSLGMWNESNKKSSITNELYKKVNELNGGKDLRHFIYIFGEYYAFIGDKFVKIDANRNSPSWDILKQYQPYNIKGQENRFATFVNVNTTNYFRKMNQTQFMLSDWDIALLFLQSTLIDGEDYFGIPLAVTNELERAIKAMEKMENLTDHKRKKRGEYLEILKLLMDECDTDDLFEELNSTQLKNYQTLKSKQNQLYKRKQLAISELLDFIRNHENDYPSLMAFISSIRKVDKLSPSRKINKSKYRNTKVNTDNFDEFLAQNDRKELLVLIKSLCDPQKRSSLLNSFDETTKSIIIEQLRQAIDDLKNEAENIRHHLILKCTYDGIMTINNIQNIMKVNNVIEPTLKQLYYWRSRAYNILTDYVIDPRNGDKFSALRNIKKQIKK